MGSLMWNEVKKSSSQHTAGRDPNALTGAIYVTVITDEDPQNRPPNGSTLISNKFMGPPLP